MQSYTHIHTPFFVYTGYASQQDLRDYPGGVNTKNEESFGTATRKNQNQQPIDVQVSHKNSDLDVDTFLQDVDDDEDDDEDEEDELDDELLSEEDEEDSSEEEKVVVQNKRQKKGPKKNAKVPTQPQPSRSVLLGREIRRDSSGCSPQEYEILKVT